MSTSLTLAPSVPKALATLIAMEKELSHSKTYEQIVDVVRRAEALKKLLGHVDEVKTQAENTILVAHVRIGEELALVPKGAGRPKKISSRTGTNSGRQATGVTKTARHRHGKLAKAGVQAVKATAAQLRKEGKDATPRAVATELTHGSKQDRREAKLDAVAAKAWPAGLFSIASLDPPWRFEVRSDRGLDRSADNHYPTMSIEEIMALPVPELLAKPGLLLLWATVPHMENAFKLLNHWGPTFKSMLTWDKEVAGTGHWLRNQTEHLIFATFGNFPLPPDDRKLTSLWRERKGKHSAKPEGLLDWVDEVYPAPLPKIELFRRGPARPGWKVWGYEATPADDTA